MPTVAEIVEWYLKVSEYDGLFRCDGQDGKSHARSYGLQS